MAPLAHPYTDSGEAARDRGSVAIGRDVQAQEPLPIGSGRDRTSIAPCAVRIGAPPDGANRTSRPDQRREERHLTDASAVGDPLV